MPDRADGNTGGNTDGNTGEHPDESMSAEEARLLSRLGGAIGADPPPAGMAQRVEGLLAFREVDRELLELLQDAAAEPAGMRGAVARDERLAFDLGAGQVSLELVPERDGLHGQVLSGDVADVVLERVSAEPQTTPVDAIGTFFFARPGPGPARLRLKVRSGAPVTTDWFLL